jgi:hypothetical protein
VFIEKAIAGGLKPILNTHQAVMPPKQPPPPLNPIETIKQCLTASSCSASTVSLLGDTLRGAPATTAKTARTTKTTTTKKTVAAKDAGLPILDRSRLAVEVINTTLRALSDAAKSTDPKAEAAPVKAKASTGRAASKVLQSRSGNSDAATQDPQDAVDYLAECCSASLSFLISVENAEGVPTMQPLQTENARLSLLTKLLQLGRFEKALEELKQLKRRLQVAMGVAVSADMSGDKASVAKTTGKLSAKSKAAGKENGIKNESLSSQDELAMLLEFPEISASSAAFPLVISFQLAVLRCIVGLKRTESIEVRELCCSLEIKANSHRSHSFLHFHLRTTHSHVSKLWPNPPHPKLYQMSAHYHK